MLLLRAQVWKYRETLYFGLVYLVNPGILGQFLFSEIFWEHSELYINSESIFGIPVKLENVRLPGDSEQPFLNDAPYFGSPNPHNIVDPMLCTERNSFAAQLNRLPMINTWKSYWIRCKGPCMPSIGLYIFKCLKLAGLYEFSGRCIVLKNWYVLQKFPYFSNFSFAHAIQNKGVLLWLYVHCCQYIDVQNKLYKCKLTRKIICMKWLIS